MFDICLVGYILCHKALVLYLFSILFVVPYRAHTFHLLHNFKEVFHFHVYHTSLKKALIFALIHSCYFKYGMVFFYSTIQQIMYFIFYTKYHKLFLRIFDYKDKFTFLFHDIFIFPSKLLTAKNSWVNNMLHNTENDFRYLDNNSSYSSI
jgi:hypothetical protein